MQSFQNFEYEIKINIFKYVDHSLNLALTCRNWSVIAKDPHAKSEWLLVHYGKAHALFHAVRFYRPSMPDFNRKKSYNIKIFHPKVINALWKI